MGFLETQWVDLTDAGKAKVRNRERERDTHTHTRARKQSNKHARTHASKHTHTHTHAHTHAHTRIHTHTHAHTHARTHARTHAHTHTHTHPITYTFTQKWFKAECSVFFGYSQTPYISHTYWFGNLPTTTTTNKQTLSKQNGLSSLAIYRHVRPKTCCGLLVKLTWRYRN